MHTLIAALASVSLQAVPVLIEPSREVTSVEATESPRENPLEGRLYAGLMKGLTGPLAEPDIGLELLVPQSHLVFAAQAHAFPIGYATNYPLDLAGLELQGGLMGRFGTGGRGVTADLRAMTGVEIATFSLWGSSPIVLPCWTATAETELTYWMNASTGLSLRVHAGLNLPFGFNAGASAGIAF